jgi:hypothetical protein
MYCSAWVHGGGTALPLFSDGGGKSPALPVA